MFDATRLGYIVATLTLLLPARSALGNNETRLKQARAAIAKGDVTEARSAARQVLAVSSDSAEAEAILGLADTAEGDLQSAVLHFERSATLQPANYRAHTYLGSTYLRQKRLTEARQAFQRVLKLRPGNNVAQYNLGLIEMLEGKPTRALPYFLAVHGANPRDAAALLALLECQLHLKDSRAARESASKLHRLLPDGSPVLLQAGAALAAGGEYQSALPLLQRYSASHPKSFDAVYNLGLAQFHAGVLPAAEETMKRLLLHAPKAEAYDLLGSIQEKLGQNENALQAFGEAVKLAPNNEDYRVNYGSALVNAGRLDQAVAEFSRSVSESPDSLRMRLGLGSVLYLYGRYEEAAEAILQCVHRAPTFAPAYDLLGKIFESAPEQQDQIAAAFAAYVKSGAKNAVAHYHYGAILYAQAAGEGAGRYKLAKEQLRAAVALNPKQSEAYVQIGVIAQAEGSLQDAVVAYEKAVKLAPSYATARYRLGSTYQQLGEHAKAETELAAFRSLKAKEKEVESQTILRGLSARP